MNRVFGIAALCLLLVGCNSNNGKATKPTPDNATETSAIAEKEPTKKQKETLIKLAAVELQKKKIA